MLVAAWASLATAKTAYFVRYMRSSYITDQPTAAISIENRAAALSTARTDAVAMFACRPTPKREPSTPGMALSTMASAAASEPVPRLRSS